MEAVRRKSPGICIELVHRSACALPLGLGLHGAMEGVRRKSPGFCIGWFTGVLAHFRLDWGWLFHFHSIESKVSIISPV
jgi:hypothetical protein